VKASFNHFLFQQKALLAGEKSAPHHIASASHIYFLRVSFTPFFSA
jgi:hypothetical protein